MGKKFGLVLVMMLIGAGVSGRRVKAAGDVFLINQIRGEECCDVGSRENLQAQLETVASYGYPAQFLWRYDALTDPEYIQLWQEKAAPNFTPGLWVEVTPTLASDSGVVYRGDEDTWHQAENALLVGYTPVDRAKLLETLLQQFTDVFGTMPIIAGAWGIDTQSLNYLHEQGVAIFMTVREQTGTDSYTHVGGPEHYPYFASENWYLNPSVDMSGVLIVKHTITDPLNNYGDPTSTYTSQPNDYTHENLTTDDYFAELLAQALGQPQDRGWAVIGLENSMGVNWQAEYARQLEILHDFQEHHEDIQVLTPVQALERWKSDQTLVRLLVGQDLIYRTDVHAYWIQTPRYRLRFRQSAVGLILDDVRVYDPEFTDYYSDQVASNGLFQIVPALMDGSLILPTDQKGTREKYFQTERDEVIRRGWRWPTLASDFVIAREGEEIVFAYQDEAGTPIELRFGAESWETNYQPEALDDSSPEGDWPWTHDDYPSQVVVAQTESGWQVTYLTRPELLAAAREKYRAVLMPERDETVDQQSQTTTWGANLLVWWQSLWWRLSGK